MAKQATITFYQGIESGMPSLGDGEPGWTTDTHKLFIGQSGTNYEVTGSGGGSGTGTGCCYTDELAQDAIGGIVDAGSNGHIAFTYDDATPTITADFSARGFAVMMTRISMRG